MSNSAYSMIEETEGRVSRSPLFVPVWEKYTLTIVEAAAYFRIGENKLRNLVNENPDADYILWNGNRPQIKRIKFEKLIDRLSAI